MDQASKVKRIKYDAQIMVRQIPIRLMLQTLVTKGEFLIGDYLPCYRKEQFQIRMNTYTTKERKLFSKVLQLKIYNALINHFKYALDFHSVVRKLEETVPELQKEIKELSS